MYYKKQLFECVHARVCGCYCVSFNMRVSVLFVHQHIYLYALSAVCVRVCVCDPPVCTHLCEMNVYEGKQMVS